MIRRRRKVIIEWGVILVIAVRRVVPGASLCGPDVLHPVGIDGADVARGGPDPGQQTQRPFGTINTGDIIVFKAPPTEHCGDGNFPIW